MVKSKTKLVRVGIREAEFLNRMKEKNKLSGSSAALEEMVNFFEMQKKRKKLKQKIIREIEF